MYIATSLLFNVRETDSLALDKISQVTECVRSSQLFPLDSIFVQLTVGRTETLGQLPQFEALTM